MDLVDYSEEAFNKVVEQYNDFAGKIDVTDIRYIPISALEGDNVVNDSVNMPGTRHQLMHTLETYIWQR